MISQLLIGKPFFDGTWINIGIVLLEIAAIGGVYASPAIIWRYAIARHSIEENRAKKFSVIYALIYIAAVAALTVVFKQGILPALFVACWSYFSYKILVSKEDGTGNFIVKLCDKYQEILVYIIVGVITTVVAWAVFYVLSIFLDSDNPVLLTINTILNWTAGVLVAYPMNRHWVFHSTNDNKLKEFIGFVASRVTTLIIEEVVMILCVNVIGINQYVSKYVIASILVIILNYVFSKLFVFKKKEDGK